MKFFKEPLRLSLTLLWPDESLAHLTRLSQKEGVQSTLILSRDNGAIIRTSGLISKSASVNPNSTLPAPQDPLDDTYNGKRSESGINNAEDVARLVWNFVGAAGTLVDGLESDNEVKLLRVRTKHNELLIIPGVSPTENYLENTDLTLDPDTKFLMVVIHKTPPA